MQAELGRLTTMLADKEKELKISQEELEAQKDEVMRMTKELQNRDGAFLDVDVSTSKFGCWQRTFSGVVSSRYCALEANIEKQVKRQAKSARVYKVPHGA